MIKVSDIIANSQMKKEMKYDMSGSMDILKINVIKKTPEPLNTDLILENPELMGSGFTSPPRSEDVVDADVLETIAEL